MSNKRFGLALVLAAGLAGCFASEAPDSDPAESLPEDTSTTESSLRTIVFGCFTPGDPFVLVGITSTTLDACRARCAAPNVCIRGICEFGGCEFPGAGI